MKVIVEGDALAYVEKMFHAMQSSVVDLDVTIQVEAEDESGWESREQEGSLAGTLALARPLGREATLFTYCGEPADGEGDDGQDQTTKVWPPTVRGIREAAEFLRAELTRGV